MFKENIIYYFLVVVFYYIYFKISTMIFNNLPIDPRVDVIVMFIMIFILIPISLVSSRKLMDAIKKLK